MQMNRENAFIKWTLIVGCELFLALFLILPLVFIIQTAFAQGLATYCNSITDQYAVKAAWLTVKATLWAVGVNTLFGLSAGCSWIDRISPEKVSISMLRSLN